MYKSQRIDGLPNARVLQIHSIGGLEGERVILIGGPSICFLRTSTSGHAVVELTSSRIDSPPPQVGNRNSPNNDDGADLVELRTEGISVNDLEAAGLRVRSKSTEALMHLLAIVKSACRANQTASAVTRLEAMSTKTVSRTWSRQLTLR